ncbi:hypothetical protein PPERSA_11836 [Pseudocohnilembus persalinus]|uniref:Large ribosomal subunit protein eL22 n=1 Tax=Pseudocohnilembus persalinus TaxID=266149 RepID=A0A0V0QKC2_PSEPJ|nr:hypothetical protein PPERSA_11836 [Pseudocohnilembus persalinus]|eukprot:KRX02496.1 hypothetical protein PPERSA_11836 [Pseudocohnilembus persalinus]
MSRIQPKNKKQTKGNNLKFTIDCAQPIEDKVLLIQDFVDFLKKRIKVEGKTGNLGNEVAVNTQKNTQVVVTSTIPFSKRYLKYLTKKYLKKQTLRNFLYVSANSKDSYQLRYFNIQNEQNE